MGEEKWKVGPSYFFSPLIFVKMPKLRVTLSNKHNGWILNKDMTVHSSQILVLRKQFVVGQAYKLEVKSNLFLVILKLQIFQLYNYAIFL